MKRFPILLGTASLIIVLAACSHEQAAVTRGIGVYPGDPDESAAPSVVKGDDTYRNIAFGRITYQSSSYDYNLTSQLITDGIISDGPVAYVDVTGGGKAVDKPNHEKLFDGKPDSRIYFDVADPTVQIGFKGMPVLADRIEILGSATLPEGKDKTAALTVRASVDGVSWTELGKVPAAKLFAPPAAPRRYNMGGGAPVEAGPSPVKFLYDYKPAEPADDGLIPFQLVNGGGGGGVRTVSRNVSCVIDLKDPQAYESFCLAFNLPDAREFSLHTVNYFKDGVLLDVLPSTKFVSAWRSAGAADEWVSVDFGFPSSFDKLVFHWLNPAASGEVLVSNDALVWTSVAKVDGAEDFGEVKLAKAAKGRFVKVMFDGSADGRPLELAELEVFGRGGAPWCRRTRRRGRARARTSQAEPGGSSAPRWYGPKAMPCPAIPSTTPAGWSRPSPAQYWRATSTQAP